MQKDCKKGTKLYYSIQFYPLVTYKLDWHNEIIELHLLFVGNFCAIITDSSRYKSRFTDSCNGHLVADLQRTKFKLAHLFMKNKPEWLRYWRKKHTDQLLTIEIDWYFGYSGFVSSSNNNSIIVGAGCNHWIIMATC